ncbi:MAG: ABC transporter ATP-binding protein [Flavobacteriales bacterium]
MSKVSGKAFDLHLIKRVFSYARPVKGVLYGTLFLTILLAFLGPLRPYLINIMVNEHIGNGDAKGLFNWTMLVIGILFLEGIVQFYQTYWANWLGQRIVKDMRVELYDKIVSFRSSYFDNTAIGRLVTRAVSDMETIASIFSQGVLIIIGDLLKLVVVVLAMFLISWKFSLLVLIPIPILLYATRKFKDEIKKAFQEVRQQVSRLNTFVQEHITGMNIVQAFNREKKEYERFQRINAEHRDAHIRSVWAFSIFFPVVEMLSALSISILIFYGVLRLNQGAANIQDIFGQIFAFILYIHMLYRPIRQLSERFNVLQMGMVGSERVFNILDTEDHIADQGSMDPPRIEGELCFENVWFAYRNDEYVLKDVDLKVESGENIAIVGETGAGKTSIINLLGRFYEFQKGRITIDGTDIRSLDLHALRQNIGIVPQDVFLFSDTIMNNIILYDQSISKDEVVEAAKAVGAHEFIERLPGDYDYDVRERGGMLSLGQRQLIAFIRAYVYDPSVLVLDEATSSVDPQTEELIQQAIERLTRDRTSIVIAHRLSTVQRADRILVMDQGRIIESGEHRELLEKGGHYKRLYELQFSG